MSILDKAKEAAVAAVEKTMEVASSAVEVVEEAGIKAKELAQEAGTAVAESISATAGKARELASEAGDMAKGIGTAIADATFGDNAREIAEQARIAQEEQIAPTGETSKGAEG